MNSKVATAARSLARLAPYDVAFIRHGNTGKAATDLQRSLTEKGMQQCAAANAGYLARLPSPLASFAVTSPALRCNETANRILAGHAAADDLVEVQQLYDGMLQPGASDVFKRLGYASLLEYMSDNDEIRADLDDHGEQVVGALAACVTVRMALDDADGKARAADSSRQTLCVFGHAVYLNVAALRLADLRAHPQATKEVIMRTSTQEASGFWVGGLTSEILRAE